MTQNKDLDMTKDLKTDMTQNKDLDMTKDMEMAKNQFNLKI
jgi:hypothetical protein